MGYHMLRKFSLALAFLSSTFLFSQADHVKWSFAQKKLSADEYELSFTAKIDPTWHLYSQIEGADVIEKKDGSKIEVRILEDGIDAIKYRKPNEPNGKTSTIKRDQVANIVYAEGPTPTSFQFDPSKAFQLVGKTIEPKPHEAKEAMFDDVIVRSFDTKAVFTQKVKITAPSPVTIIGYIDGQTCNESQCQKFSPSVKFTFVIADAQVTAAANLSTDTTQVANDSLSVAADVASASALNGETKEMSFEAAPIKKTDESYLGLFIAGFLGGLLALLTPCVFPMLPMTVSFFIKQSKTKAAGIRNAIIYGLSIIGIYIALGLGVTLVFGADAVNNMASSVGFNLVFFLLLVVFAISFLGAFEITLPSSFVNKMDAKSDKGGLVGIFFMAFTLALVSFSCTGPIIGTLLVEAAATGALAGPFFGMFGFSLALALPFALFAAFPGWLNTLPKSGGWLNSVKVVLGFLELALSLKFLSNADLVVQSGYVTREVFLVLWIIIFGLLGAYLMGWFKLPHDSDMKHVSVGRLLFAIIVFSFTFYLVPGLWGAPLKIISGFPPPDFYSESPEGFGGKTIAGGSSNSVAGDLPEHAHRGPHGIPAFDDYYLALEYAKKVNKPLMIDFTGWACVNCRKMENQVWIDSEVKRKLTEDFILVSLYVDDKKTLPDALQKDVVWHGDNRHLKSVGDRWQYLQNTHYDSSTQPQYWIIDANENRYSDPTSYDSDVHKYINWLDAGLEKYKKQSH
jgi:thiol:disulfide interchange protein DsbD